MKIVESDGSGHSDELNNNSDEENQIDDPIIIRLMTLHKNEFSCGC